MVDICREKGKAVELHFEDTHVSLVTVLVLCVLKDLCTFYRQLSQHNRKSQLCSLGWWEPLPLSLMFSLRKLLG